MARLAWFFATGSLACGLVTVLAGCGPSADAEPKPESTASKQQAADEAGQWSKENMDAFKKAHDRARKGEDK